MGDDLDDGLLLDEHLIAQSDDDEQAPAVPDAVDTATQKKRQYDKSSPKRR